MTGSGHACGTGTASETSYRSIGREVLHVGWVTGRRVAGVVMMVTLVGCGSMAAPSVDPDPADGPDPSADVDDSSAVDEPEPLPGEAEAWDLIGSSPDGRLLTLATTGGGCSSFRGWVSEEDADGVHVEARWEHTGGEVCAAILLGDQMTLRLGEPLGDRQLTGCGRDDCLSEPDDSDDQHVGPTNQVSVADDVVVVTGHDTVWSIAPSDGTVRWERARDGYWSWAVDGMVLRYDHLDRIEMVDASTGETRWDADGVTLAGVDGDEVVVCPREQVDVPHEERESFRGALSLDDGSWLWRDDEASCTTDSIGQDEPDVPEVDLDPVLVGRGLAVDLAARDGVVYVATSTAIIALDADTGERRWWTPLAPTTAVDVGGVHVPPSR